MRNMLFFTALLGAALAYGTGCGDDGGSSTGGTGGTGGSTSTGGTTGGTGGSTGGTTSMGGSTGGSTGGTGGATGGTGGTGGTTTSSNLVNGCDPATAEDHTNEATTTVTQSGFNYSPKCIRIAAGSSVKFMSSFMSHPLVGGTVEAGAKVPDANSPITMTSSGTEATFAFPDAGAYGYYCDFHALSGMVGAIFVE